MKQKTREFTLLLVFFFDKIQKCTFGGMTDLFDPLFEPVTKDRFENGLQIRVSHIKLRLALPCELGSAVDPEGSEGVTRGSKRGVSWKTLS